MKFFSLMPRYAAILLSLTVLLGLQGIPPYICLSQQTTIDSLKTSLENMELDTNRVIALNRLSEFYIRRDPQKAMHYGEQALEFAEVLNYRKGMGEALRNIGGTYEVTDYYDDAMHSYKRSLDLSMAVKDREGVAKTRILTGYLYLVLNQDNLALEYFRRGLKMAETLELNFLIASAHNGIGKSYQNRNDTDKAMSHHKRSLKLSVELNEEALEGEVRLNIASVHMSLGDHSTAMEQYMKSLKNAEESGDSLGAARTTRSLGRAHYYRENYDKALEYCHQSLDMFERLQHRRGIALALLTIGIIHVSRGEYEIALEYDERSLAIAEKIGHKILISCLLNNIGIIYLDYFHDEDKALEYYGRSLKIDKELGDKGAIANTLSNMGLIYSFQGKFTKAVEYLQNSLGIAHEIGDRELRVWVYYCLFRTDTARGNYKQALEYHQLYVSLKDSVLNEKNMKHINELTAQYEAGKREKQIELLEKEKQLQANIVQREKLIRNVVIGGSILLLIVAVLVYRRIQDRRRAIELRAEAAEYQVHAAEAKSRALEMENERREKEAGKLFTRRLIESQEHERKRVAAELHDELGQDLLVIRNRLLLAMERDADAEMKQELDEISDTVLSTLDEVRQISRNLRPYKLERLGLSGTVRSMLKEVAATTRIDFEWEIGRVDGLFAKNDEINIYRIFQEGANNVLKHSEASRAVVNMEQHGSEVRIEIEDDGKGFSVSPTGAFSGFGIQGMRERVEMLGGTMAIVSSPGTGTKISIVLPIIAREENSRNDEVEFDSMLGGS